MGNGMCPNSHSEGLVRGRGARWRPLVSPAGSTLISFSVATHSSALAFPCWHWGFFSMAAAACTAWGWLECTGVYPATLGAVQCSVQSHGCALWEQDRDTVPPEQDTATVPPLGCSLVTSPPLPASFLCSSPMPVLHPLTNPHRAAREGSKVWQRDGSQFPSSGLL